MPLLPYCLLEGRADVAPPERGVRDAPVMSLAVEGLACWASPWDDAAHPPESSRRVEGNDALAFHQVIEHAFRSTAVIPFRFPTVAADESALLTGLRPHLEEYAQTLIRIAERVQMDVRIRARPDPSEPSSGRAYLERRRKTVSVFLTTATVIERAAAGIEVEWRRRDYPSELRCHALIRRSAIESFRTLIETAFDTLRRDGADVSVVVSGPWPVWEFLTR